VEGDFEQLYNTYYMQVYSYVMTLTGNSHASEEITQRAFFKAMTAKKNFRGDSTELTWLCAIAKNIFADEFRVQKRRSQLDAAAVADDGIENALVDEDFAFRIHQVLHGLSEPYKEVFQLRVFGELPFHKIGLIFSKTENWARVTYHRARLRIQERMETQ